MKRGLRVIVTPYYKLYRHVYSLHVILQAHVRVEDCILQFMTKEETVDFNATAHNMEPNLTKAGRYYCNMYSLM